MKMYNKLYAKNSEFWTSTKLFVWKKVEQKLVIDKLKVTKCDKLLEVGCNTGKFLKRVVGKVDCDTYAIDFNDYAVKKAKNIFPDFNIEKMDATAMKFKDNTFDKIFSLHVLEHVPNYKAVLKEIYRVLNPKGLFVIAVPTERIRGDLALGGIIFTGKNGHLHKFNYYQMCKDIKHEGFEIEDAYLCIGFPFIAVNFKKIRFPLIASFFSYSMVFSCRKK